MTVPTGIMRANVAPSAASLLPNPFLYTLPRVLWGKVKDFFGYTVNFTGTNILAASATQTLQTTIQNDSAFVIIAAVAVVTDSADTTQITFVPQTVQIQDQSAGRNFFDSATHFHNVYGTAQAPAYWTLPRLVKAGATLSTTLANLEAFARNVRISYLGFKIFNQDVTNEMVGQL